MKKITSMFMAVAMILALTVPALAQSTPSGKVMGTTTSAATLTGYESNFVGEYQDTKIDIELPNNVSLVFNPYRLEYNAAASHASEGDAYLVDKLADQIFSAPVTIVSKSNIQLQVDMAFTVTVGGDEILLVDEDTYDAAVNGALLEDGTRGEPEPGKNVLLQFQYGLVDAKNDAPSTGGANMRTITLSKTEGEALQLTTLQQNETTKAEEDSNYTAQELTVTIPAAPTGAEKYFSYKFTGKAQTVTASPEDEKNPYEDTETIGVGIAFSFVPVANDPNQLQANEVFDYSTDTDGRNITVNLPAPLTLRGDTALSGVTPTYASGADTLAGVTYTSGATTITIKKEAIADSKITGKTAPYVVIIPVIFTADIGTGDTAQLKTYEYNVRLIMKPPAT